MPVSSKNVLILLIFVKWKIQTVRVFRGRLLLSSKLFEIFVLRKLSLLLHEKHVFSGDLNIL